MHCFGSAAAIPSLQLHSAPRILRSVAIAAMSGLIPLSEAQVLEHFNPIGGNPNGVHLSGVSISTMQYTGSAAGTGLGVPIGPTLSNSDGVGMLQAAATFGWARKIEKSSISLMYSPSYVRGVRTVNFDSTNHALSFSVSRNLSSKWSLGVSMTGVVNDFNQLLFGRTRYSDIAMTPSTFDEFAAAILTGRSTNPALMQVVNAAPVISSPEAAFLYGGRILSASVSVSVSYAYSSRSSLSLSVGSTRTQFFDRGSNAGNGNSFSVPWTTSGTPTINWNYSLTPRTTIGANLSSSRTLSRLQDAYVSQGGVSIGRTMSNRWFLSGLVGLGWVKPLRQTYPLPQRPQMTYGGGIGYKLYVHTFVASFNRTVADSYGLGASATEASSGAWSWKRPGWTVSTTSGFGYTRLISPAFPNARSVTAFVSVGKALSSQLTVSTSYSYVRFPTFVLVTAPNVTQSGVSVSLSWSPSARR